MSFPANPLDKFQSFSYHHFMVVTNDTDLLLEFIGKRFELKYHKAKLGDVLMVKENRAVIMLHNPMIESGIAIDSLKYKIAFATPFNTTGMVGVSSGSQVEMTMTEPAGLMFMNKLRSLQGVLQTTGNGMQFAILTTFTGHTASGETHSVLDCSPLIGMMSSMKANFSHSGGVYSITMIAAAYGGAEQHHSIRNTEANVTPQATDGRLVTAIKDLEKKLNDRLRLEWTAAGNKPDAHKNRLLQYVITYPAAWEQFMLNAESDNRTERNWAKDEKQSQVAGEAPQAKKLGTIYVPLPPRATINTALHTLISKTPAIYERMVSGGMGNLRVPKIESQVYLSGHTMVAGYDIREFINVEPPPATSNEVPRGIVFDYLFTGKNTDIETFDMTMEDAHIAINSMPFVRRVNDAWIGSADQNADRAVGKVVEDMNPERAPLVVGANVMDVQTKIRNHDAYLGNPDLADQKLPFRSVFFAMMAAKYSKNILGGQMKIRGNPYLYNQMIFEPRSIDPIVRQTDMNAQDNAAGDIAKQMTDNKTPVGDNTANVLEGVSGTTLSVASPGTLPTLVKVRVKMPVSNNPWDTTYEPFWYDGWFFVLEAESEFTGGAFKQTLFLQAANMGF